MLQCATEKSLVILGWRNLDKMATSEEMKGEVEEGGFGVGIILQANHAQKRQDTHSSTSIKMTGQDYG